MSVGVKAGWSVFFLRPVICNAPLQIGLYFCRGPFLWFFLAVRLSILPSTRRQNECQLLDPRSTFIGLISGNGQCKRHQYSLLTAQIGQVGRRVGSRWAVFYNTFINDEASERSVTMTVCHINDRMHDITRVIMLPDDRRSRANNFFSAVSWYRTVLLYRPTTRSQLNPQPLACAGYDAPHTTLQRLRYSPTNVI